MYNRLLTNYWPQDKEFPQRAYDLAGYERVLDGTMYDNLFYPFTEERNRSDEYIPVHNRRPSVRLNLCRLVVRDSASLLFGEGHWPTIETSDETTRTKLKQLLKESQLASVMLDAVMKGAVGSVCVYLQVLKDRPFFSALPTKFLTPYWDPMEPDKLLLVKDEYKVLVSTLKGMGYTFPANTPDSQLWWWRRDYTETGEIWYLPQALKDHRDGVAYSVDTGRSVGHSLGFLPMVWIKNLPGGPSATDGACTFTGAIDTQMEAEYQMSQGGRGLRYSSDPLLLIKEPPSEDPETSITRSSSAALRIDADGDAKLLEISGTAVAAVLDYVKMLRDLALENIRGSRSSPEKLTTAQSGRAIELLYQSLIWLADDLRSSYGENGILPLIQMLVAANDKIALRFKDKTRVGPLSSDGLALRWPNWFAPTPNDKVQETQAIATAREAGIMSRELGVKGIADMYDDEDVPKEIGLIEADIATDDAREIKLAAQTKVSGSQVN